MQAIGNVRATGEWQVALVGLIKTAFGARAGDAPETQVDAPVAGR